MVDEKGKNNKQNNKSSAAGVKANSRSGDPFSSAPVLLQFENMYKGYFPLWRKITEWEWYQDGDTVRVFLHLLLLSNHKTKFFKGLTILPGQCLTGRKRLSTDLKLSERKIRTSIKHLKMTNEVTTKTTSRYTLITLNNYTKYVPIRPEERPTVRPTSDQPVTTPNNDNNDNNIYRAENADVEKSCLSGKEGSSQGRLSRRKQQFVEAWQRYPRKEGRSRAEKLFLSSVKTEGDISKLNVALDNYLRYITDLKVAPQYVLAGKNFFRDWADWVKTPAVRAKKESGRVRYV